MESQKRGKTFKGNTDAAVGPAQKAVRNVKDFQYTTIRRRLLPREYIPSTSVLR